MGTIKGGVKISGGSGKKQGVMIYRFPTEPEKWRSGARPIILLGRVPRFGAIFPVFSEFGRQFQIQLFNLKLAGFLLFVV